MPPKPDRSNSQAALVSVGVGVVVLGAALGYAWFVEARNKKARDAAKPVIEQHRAPVQFGTPDVETQQLPLSVRARPPQRSRTAGQVLAETRAEVERLASQGEFAAAFKILDTKPPDDFPEVRDSLDPLKAEIEALVEAACEEAEERASREPEFGVEGLEDLAGRVPAAAATRLLAIRDKLRKSLGEKQAEALLAEAAKLIEAGRLDEGVMAYIQASRRLDGDRREQALSRAAASLRRARYEGLIPASTLAAIDVADLDRVENAVEAALASKDRATFDQVVARLSTLPAATPDLVAAIVLRGGSPLDAPIGEQIVEFALPTGEKRTYAVSVPGDGLPTRPRPLLLLLQPGASAPEIARGVARSFRSRLPDAIVAVGIPDAAAGWGPNRLGEQHVTALLADIRSRWLYDPDRVVLSGISAGAHGVWFQGMRHGDRFAALLGVAGTPYAPMYGSHWLDWIGNLRGTSSVALCGGKDTTFPPDFARTFERLAHERGAEVTVVMDAEAGHEAASAEAHLKALQDALAIRRNTWPKSITWSTDSLATARCAWVEITAFPAGNPEMTINFVDDAGRTVEKRRIQRECSRVDAELAGQEIRLITTRVDRVRLLFNPAWIDLSKPVRVRLNGAPAWAGNVEASSRTIVEEAWMSKRRDRAIYAVQTVGGE